MRRFHPLLISAALIALSAGPLAAQGPDAPMPPQGETGHQMMPPHGRMGDGMMGHGRMKHPHRMARLTVSGQGQAATQPDIATISLGVGSRAASAAEAMTQNSQAQAALIEALKSEGIEARDIQTSGLSLSPMLDYSNQNEAPKLTGYAAQNNVTVRVRDIAGLGAVLDKLVAAGANEIGSIAFSRDDMTEAEDQARTAAVQDAHRRAGIMAEAAGLRLGPLLTLSDSPAPVGPMPMARMAMAAAPKADVPIEAGELSISVDVTAVYALLPAGMPGQDMPEPEDGMTEGEPAPAN